MSNPLPYLAIILLLLASAFFSASEIAYAGANKLRLKSILQEKNSLSVRLAIKINENYDDTLSAILIGNNLANVGSSSVATVIVIALLGDSFAWVATVIMTLLVLTFGEIIPKVLAKQFPEIYCIAVSLPVYLITLIFKPVTAVVMLIVNVVSKLWSKNISDSDAVSEDDFENIIDIVEDEGVLDEEQCDLLQNALDFSEVCAYEIITPRVDMEAIDIRDPYEINEKKILASTYSRIPVYEDTPDNIIGILYMNHAYKGLVSGEKINIRQLMLPVVFVHKTMPLPDVLEKMKENKCQMIVVLDEYGGTMGILTMEDVLEQLVGEIFDENDDIEPEFVCIDDNRFEADGDMRIYDFFDEFDIDVEDDENFDGDTATVGGFVTSMLDGNVNCGDTFCYGRLEITVLQADEKRVGRIAVTEKDEENPEQI